MRIPKAAGKSFPVKEKGRLLTRPFSLTAVPRP